MPFRPDPAWPPRPIMVLGHDGYHFVDLADYPDEWLWAWRDQAADDRYGPARPDTVEWIDAALADRGVTGRPAPVPRGDQVSVPNPTT